MRSDNFVVCKYFNAKGNCLRQIVVEHVGEVDASSSRMTSRQEGALAVQVLLVEVTTERARLALARRVRSVSVGDHAPIAVGEVLPELEAGFGASSTQWANAIFTHLRLVPPTIQ